MLFVKAMGITAAIFAAIAIILTAVYWMFVLLGPFIAVALILFLLVSLKIHEFLEDVQVDQRWRGEQ